jgi:hypothetical protein
MNPPADGREITILESRGILIKDQLYHAVLTNRQIILTSYSDIKPRSINIRDIQKTELATDDSGDPVIMIFLPSVAGETKKVILHFSKKNFPDPRQVSSLWLSEINKAITSLVPPTPDTYPKKDSGVQAFCVKCGKKFTDGSVFCNGCGTKILYPVQPFPPAQSDAGIQDTIIAPKISTGKIELPPKKISLPDAADTHTKEKIPVTAPLHKGQGKKKSLFSSSIKRKHTIIVVVALAGVILLITAFFVFVPSGSTGFNLTFPGMNFTVPSFNGTPSTTNQVVTSPTVPNTARIPATPVQTRTPVRTRPTPVQTTKP